MIIIFVIFITAITMPDDEDDDDISLLVTTQSDLQMTGRQARKRKELSLGKR